MAFKSGGSLGDQPAAADPQPPAQTGRGVGGRAQSVADVELAITKSALAIFPGFAPQDRRKGEQELTLAQGQRRRRTRLRPIRPKPQRTLEGLDDAPSDCVSDYEVCNILETARTDG